MRAREVRGNISFGEQILDIADNTATDWSYNEKTGKLSVKKALVLRSKIRVEARQFQMSRLHPKTWAGKQTLDIKNDGNLLTARTNAAAKIGKLVFLAQHFAAFGVPLGGLSGAPCTLAS